jgi:hypothetical protein
MRGKRLDTRPDLISIRMDTDPASTPLYIGVSQTEAISNDRTEQGFVVCTHGHVTMHVGSKTKLKAGALVSFGKEETKDTRVDKRKKRYGIETYKNNNNPLIGVVLSNQLNRYSTVDVLLHPSRQCWVEPKVAHSQDSPAVPDQAWRLWTDKSPT